MGNKRLLKLGLTLGLGLIFVALSGQTVYAGPVSLAELVNDRGVWDHKEVVVVGEGIGDRMERGNYAWLNILDKGIAVGVWGNKDLMKNIHTLGDYSSAGDWVEVKGEFHLSCPEHGGDTDIHADEIKILQPGHKVSHPVQAEKIVIAAILFALASVLGVAVYLGLRRERKKLNGNYIP